MKIKVTEIVWENKRLKLPKTATVSLPPMSEWDSWEGIEEEIVSDLEDTYNSPVCSYNYKR